MHRVPGRTWGRELVYPIITYVVLCTVLTVRGCLLVPPRTVLRYCTALSLYRTVVRRQLDSTAPTVKSPSRGSISIPHGYCGPPVQYSTVPLRSKQPLEPPRAPQVRCSRSTLPITTPIYYPGMSDDHLHPHDPSQGTLFIYFDI